jgi:NADH:ubiquinone oxidoreductase subunit E
MGLPVHDQYDLEQTIHTIVNRYGGKAVGLIMVLQDVQKHYRYLPVEALKLVAQKMTLPIAQVYAVATFYKSFSLTPKGKHHICVCTGTACHVRQANVILEDISRDLGIEPGQTTPDGEISYETVNCLGACALGPLVTVDDEYHGNMTVTKMGKLMDELLGRQTPVEEKVEETA